MSPSFALEGVLDTLVLDSRVLEKNTGAPGEEKRKAKANCFAFVASHGDAYMQTCIAYARGFTPMSMLPMTNADDVSANAIFGLKTVNL